MPGPDLDIVHAGVVLQLEVHDVVVSGRVAVIIEHHHLGHVAELEVVEVLLQSGGGQFRIPPQHSVTVLLDSDVCQSVA